MFRHSWLPQKLRPRFIISVLRPRTVRRSQFSRGTKFHPSNLIEYPPTRISLATINIHTMGNGNSFYIYIYMCIYTCAMESLYSSSIFVTFFFFFLFFSSSFKSPLFVTKKIPPLTFRHRSFSISSI